jgi:hypothetical protein
MSFRTVFLAVVIAFVLILGKSEANEKSGIYEALSGALGGV